MRRTGAAWQAESHSGPVGYHELLGDERNGAEIAIVWKPNDRRLYIDGKLLIHNTSAYPPSRLDAFHGTLGAHSPHHAFTFNGTFDNLKIWSRALSETELQ